MRHSPFATRHWPFPMRHWPLATPHTPFATHHSPFATHHTPFASRRWPNKQLTRHQQIPFASPWRKSQEDTQNWVNLDFLSTPLHSVFVLFSFSFGSVSVLFLFLFLFFIGTKVAKCQSNIRFSASSRRPQQRKETPTHLRLKIVAIRNVLCYESTRHQQTPICSLNCSLVYSFINLHRFFVHVHS